MEFCASLQVTWKSFLSFAFSRTTTCLYSWLYFYIFNIWLFDYHDHENDADIGKLDYSKMWAFFDKVILVACGVCTFVFHRWISASYLFLPVKKENHCHLSIIPSPVSKISLYFKVSRSLYICSVCSPIYCLLNAWSITLKYYFCEVKLGK